MQGFGTLETILLFLVGMAGGCGIGIHFMDMKWRELLTKNGINPSKIN